MMSFRRSAASIVLALPLTGAVLAQTPATPALDIRMGLWEVTSTVDFGGQVPGIDTSKMTPEQKARMAGAMRGMMAPQTTVTKSCMTRENFERKNFLVSQKDCTQTFTKNTKTVLEGTTVCTGERASTGTTHVEAPTPTGFTGTTKSTTTMRGQTTNVGIKMVGKWLGADCGTVK